ncbi:MAG: 2-C-methyl-D-erythritol 2,4-cyclodiphosphate synthase, partial [Candidatus Aminicenantes bacterium]|nr:2-C-methyl-D-erythritol 2,4-cyclodiphosphate synthase [Candidatus Aminicenantes bacterium]
TDPSYLGIRSTTLLKQTREEILPADTVIYNVDAVVTAEEPRLASFIPTMENRLAEILGIPFSRINIKAKTNEGLGDLGRGEAISAHVVVLLQLFPHSMD